MEQGEIEPPKKIRKRKSTKKSEGDSQIASAFLINAVQMFVSARFGAEAMFTPEELLLIQEPLARSIQKYGGIADEYSGLIDPLLIIGGLGLYGYRLIDIAKRQTQQKQQALNKEWLQQSMNGQQPQPSPNDPPNPFTPNGKREGESVPSVDDTVAELVKGIL